jgi:hypothetical protein
VFLRLKVRLRNSKSPNGVIMVVLRCRQVASEFDNILCTSQFLKKLCTLQPWKKSPSFRKWVGVLDHDIVEPAVDAAAAPKPVWLLYPVERGDPWGLLEGRITPSLYSAANSAFTAASFLVSN